jgi:hypothetical protein
LMDTREIKATCNRVDALVRERDSEEFMWEDAIAELGIQPEMGTVVLALLFTAEGSFSHNVHERVSQYLGA